MKKEIKPFTERLQEVILKILNTKKHKEIEKELEKHDQVLHKFIAVGQFLGPATLIRLNSDDKYRISIEEVHVTPSGYTCYVAGSTEEIQDNKRLLFRCAGWMSVHAPVLPFRIIMDDKT